HLDLKIIAHVNDASTAGFLEVHKCNSDMLFGLNYISHEIGYADISSPYLQERITWFIAPTHKTPRW
ncbi:hypothetical protein HHI36_009893, partial [Cryptolaemus montrouzieri]